MFLNSESGSSNEWVSIPKAQLPITSVAYLAQKSLASKPSAFGMVFSKAGLICSAHCTKSGNIIFIFPEVNVPVSLILRFFHSSPAQNVGVRYEYKISVEIYATCIPR